MALSTITGNVKDLTGANVASRTVVRFTLVNCGGNQPRVSSSGVIAPIIVDFIPNVSGVISGTLFSNDVDIEVGGVVGQTYYRLEVVRDGRADFHMYVRALSGATLNINNITPITTNPVVTAPTGDGTYLRLDGGNTMTGNIMPLVNGAQALGGTSSRWDAFLDLLNVTGGGNFAGTFTGNVTFSGNIIAVAGANSLKVYKLNNVLYVDGNNYPQTDAGVKSALADAVTQGGGKVVIPDAINIDKTTQWTLGTNANKQPVELEIGVGASITEKTTGGVDGFLLSDGCGIVGHGGIGETNGGGPNNNSRINIASTANLNALIAPTDRSGGQEGLYVANLLINGNASTPIASAIFDIQGVFVNTYFYNVYTQTIPCKVLRIRAGTSLKVCSDLSFVNCNFDCTAATGGIPVSIEGAAASEVSGINFFGGDIQHPGSGQKLLNIDGAGVDGGSGVHNVRLYGVHFEGNASMAASAITIADASHILIDGLVISGAASTSVVAISQTAANRTHDITVRDVRTSVTWTNVINNTINSYTSAVDVGFYHYGGGAAGAGGTSTYVYDNLTIEAKRIRFTRGTALVSGDFSLTGNWGSGSSIGTITGTDEGFTIVINTGTGPGASPGFTLTYHDGTWTNSPIVLAAVSAVSGGGAFGSSLFSSTATVLTYTFNGTPTASVAYTITVMVKGR